MDAFKRVKLLIGKEKAEKLSQFTVAIFGIGGVGGYATEALVRSGINKVVLFDSDTVSESNINRQIIANVNTVGKSKTEVMEERILSINPDASVTVNEVFFLPENSDKFDFSSFDYVIDAVDTVSAKLEIIKKAKANNVPVISCMGTGGKVDITRLKVSDIKDTSVCPLARVMRRELKNAGIKDVKVVWSDEEPKVCEEEKKVNAEGKGKDRIAPPSMIFVPAAAGLMMAKEVIFALTDK